MAASAVAYRNLTGSPAGEGPYTPQGVDNLSDGAPTSSWVIGVNNVLPVTSELVLRLTDIFLAFPPLILAMVTVTVLGNNLFTVVLAISVGIVPRFARVTRGTILSIRAIALWSWRNGPRRSPPRRRTWALALPSH